MTEPSFRRNGLPAPDGSASPQTPGLPTTPASLRELFESGRLPKSAFIEAMHALHGRLHDYARYIARTDIARIEISDGEVVMTTREHGLRFIVDPADRRTTPVEILNFGHYEKFEGDMMLNLIEDGDVVFDVGANAGYYSMRIARERPRSRIHAFEPVPPTFALLARHLELNSITTVKAHPFGLSNQEGTIVFHYYPEGSGNASALNVSGRQGVLQITSPVEPLDAVAQRLGCQVDFVKCDVEGAELLVLRGAVATLERDRPGLFVELLRKWSAPFGYHPNDVIDFLGALEYQAFVVDSEGHLVPFGRVDEQTLETNYFFLHTSRHRQLIERFSARA
ncbi:MAG: FkbM family methyltransferase [Thermoanaerobaculia bacterium]|nr:FkbM family methyltransferase [Thermoanaerobaculia bacterium]